MIPPAWKKVRISMDPNADLLVTGVDLKGKPTKVYHPDYKANNTAAKFAKTREGLIKKQAMRDQIQQNRTSENQTIRDAADVMWLIEQQATRVGGEGDTKDLAYLYDQPFGPNNVVGEAETIKKGKKKGEVVYKVALEFVVDGKRAKVPIRDQETAKQLLDRKKSGEGLEDTRYWLQSFGATTLEGRHVLETDKGVRLRFVAKETVWHDQLIGNPELAKMLVERKRSSQERGGRLFGVDDSIVRGFSKKLDGGGFTPKDFRTMRACEIALEEVNNMGDCCDSPEDYKTAVMLVAEKVSKTLGNRAEECLTSYIDPTIWSVWRNPGE
jgi:DNA topoisomerase IB